MDKKIFFRDYPRTTFRLGITMAGAVSAGAYSAGAIQYLCQAMHAWQKKKEMNLEAIWDATLAEARTGGKPIGSMSANEVWHRALKSKHLDPNRYDPSVPMHEVVIEVMGGASAGSLAAAIAVLSWGYEFQEIDASAFSDTRENKERVETSGENVPRPTDSTSKEPLNRNLLYDSWVNMACTSEEPLQRLLCIDQNEHRKPFALLNAQLLEKIKAQQLDKLFGRQRENKLKQAELPPYVSKQLMAIFSLTSLRSIRVGIRFANEVKNDLNTDPIPAHFMKIHEIMAAFQFGELKASDVYRMDPHDQELSDFLVDNAIASGAFPIGLPWRSLAFPNEYIQKRTMNLFKELDADQIDIKLDADQIFEFSAIDGGTLNNEPFIEVSEILDLRCKESDLRSHQHGRKEKNQKAIILIDPFPNFDVSTAYQEPGSLLRILRGIISTLRGQAMVKTPDKIEGLGAGDGFTRMIFPSRRKLEAETKTEGEREKYALACGGMEGFGGFLKREFRMHDFHLGMKNCQSFIRQHFQVSEKKAKHLVSFKDWKTEDQRFDRYAVEHEGVVGFPIIPDMSVSPNWRSSGEIGIKYKGIEPLSFPKIRAATLKKYRPLINRRLRFLITRLLTKSGGNGNESENGNKKRLSLFGLFSIANLLLIITLLLIVLLIVIMTGQMDMQYFWAGILVTLIALSFLYQWLIASLTRRIINSIASELKERDQLDEDI